MVGLFLPLFVEHLKDKAVELFSRKKSVTEAKELQIIDGIDDDTADILAELGMEDVQHGQRRPGRADAAQLVPVRARGRLDQPGHDDPPLRRAHRQKAADAQAVLQKIADATYTDYKTNLFWSLWQHRKDTTAAAADAIDETLAKGEGQRAAAGNRAWHASPPSKASRMCLWILILKAGDGGGGRHGTNVRIGSDCIGTRYDFVALEFQTASLT